jgi:very-short-patch-repair endonuclease
LDGWKFRRQHAVGPFILDFYCHEAKLAVEVDGGIHAKDAQRRKDVARSQALTAEGVRVLRFWDGEILRDIESVAARIWIALTPTLSQRERVHRTIPRRRET